MAPELFPSDPKEHPNIWLARAVRHLMDAADDLTKALDAAVLSGSMPLVTALRKQQNSLWSLASNLIDPPPQ